MRKIQSGELAENIQRRSIVGARSRNFILKAPKVAALALVPNHGDPSIVASVEIDSLINRRCGLELASVRHVLAVCGEPQIRSAVIESVPVNMVDYHSDWRVQNQPVHQNYCMLTVRSRIMNNISTICSPTHPADNAIVTIINESYLAPKQFNLPHFPPSKKRAWELDPRRLSIPRLLIEGANPILRIRRLSPPPETPKTQMPDILSDSGARFRFMGYLRVTHCFSSLKLLKCGQVFGTCPVGRVVLRPSPMI